MLNSLTHRSQVAQLEAGRKGPLGDILAGRRDPWEDNLAERMDLGVGNFAGELRTAQQEVQLQLCARHRSRLQPCVSTGGRLPVEASSFYIPRAFMSKAPPARPAAAPPAPYICDDLSITYQFLICLLYTSPSPRDS